MTLPRIAAIVLCAAAAARGADAQVPAGAQAPAAAAYGVDDLRGLVQALGSDRTIVLRRGDYRIPAGEGIRLALSGLRNLTIRGADGARLIGDAGGAAILTLSDSANVALDNLRFVREPMGGGRAAAPSLSAESVQGLVIDRCSFEGPADTAIELRECPGARIRRASIRGAARCALSAFRSGELELAGSSIAGCGGFPLVYLEESDQALFSSTSFADCEGGCFVEIRSGAGGGAAAGFSDCDFSGNSFGRFSGAPLLPSIEGCRFSGNSFGEDRGLAGEGGCAGELAYYAQRGSGLGFSYLPDWELKEEGGGSQVGLFDPEGEALFLVLTVCELPPQVDAARQGDRVFADAAAALIRILEKEAEVDLAIGPEGEPGEEGGLLSAEYAGRAESGGERVEARVRFIVSKGAVRAFVGLAKEASLLEPGSDIDLMIMSAEALE